MSLSFQSPSSLTWGHDGEDAVDAPKVEVREVWRVDVLLAGSELVLVRLVLLPCENDLFLGEAARHVDGSPDHLEPREAVGVVGVEHDIHFVRGGEKVESVHVE